MSNRSVAQARPPASDELLERQRGTQRSGCRGLAMPSGWFVAARSAELLPGRTLVTRFMGEDLLLYRTVSGVARAVSPYCPHLGAHLGQSGVVAGETLRCDFHRFCFDTDGACVATGYGLRTPPAARLTGRSLREQDGVLLVYHDPSEPVDRPPWEVPALDATGWSPSVFHTFRLRGHPQETTENAVDIGHFSSVHGYRDVGVLEPAAMSGPRLRARYAMTRGLGPLAFQADFTIQVHGLGYSLVEVDVKSHRFRTRQYIYATPVEPGWIDLRIAVSAQENSGLLPAVRAPLARLLSRSILFLFIKDVGQDVRIWHQKAYLETPALAEGDGPIGRYRRWARQFYPA